MSNSSPESSLFSSDTSLSSSGSSSSTAEAVAAICGGGSSGNEVLHLWNGRADTPSPQPPSMLMHQQMGGCGDGNGGGGGSDGAESMRRSLNSMDCWDYTIELECLSGGPEGVCANCRFFVRHLNTLFFVFVRCCDDVWEESSFTAKTFTCGTGLKVNKSS